MELEQHYYYGLTCLQNGDAKGALDLFKKGETLGLKHAFLFCDTGIAYAQLGQMENALEYYFKAVEADPTLGIAYYNIANYYFEIDNFKEAIYYLDISILKNSYKICNCYYLRANSYYLVSLGLNPYAMLGDRNLEQALADIKLALATCPNDDVDILTLAGYIYKRSGVSEKARDFWQKAKNLGDQDAARMLLMI